MSTIQSAQNLPKKQHFAILDGLRGIAAISVVIFHFIEFAAPDYHDNFVAHSYLAVDFFFCLSGFVIAYAYDTKLMRIGVWQFLKLRLIRLHPLIFVGAIIGLLAFVFDPFSNLYTQYGGFSTFLMFLSSVFLIPYPIVTERYFNIFHLNPPTWSLFWEYIASFFYAVLLFKIKNKTLWILTGLAALLLCYQAHRSTYLGVGWGGENFWGGGVRITFSFMAGMLVYRSKWVIRSRLGFFSLATLLALAFLFPYTGRFNRFIDPLIVICYFPLLILLGAGAKSLSQNHLRICKFAGNISYPLYIIHYPFLWIFLSYIEKTKPNMAEMRIIIGVGVVLLIVLAQIVLGFIDIPIRRYLSKNVLIKSKTTGDS